MIYAGVKGSDMQGYYSHGNFSGWGIGYARMPTKSWQTAGSRKSKLIGKGRPVIFCRNYKLLKSIYLGSVIQSI